MLNNVLQILITFNTTTLMLMVLSNRDFAFFSAQLRQSCSIGMLLLENASQLAQVLATSEIKPLFDVLPSAQLSSTLKPSIKFASPTAVSIINTLLSINAWIFALITLTQTQQPSFALIHVPSAISHRIKYAFKTAPRVTQIHS